MLWIRRLGTYILGSVRRSEIMTQRSVEKPFKRVVTRRKLRQGNMISIIRIIHRISTRSWERFFCASRESNTFDHRDHREFCL